MTFRDLSRRRACAVALAGATLATPAFAPTFALAQHGEGHDANAGHDPHAGHAAPPADHVGHAVSASALGPYPMSRDASGSSWAPDASRHGGIHAMRGDWMLMGHAQLDGVYSSQDGPRGGDKAFVAGMVMGSARRDFGAATLNLRAMLSPDPFMGRSGYPLLLAAGETADGVTPLVDRQHPHDLFMELSASLSAPVGEHGSAFVYVGYPGEPAFGPPAFMHRPAALMSPEAPISHHWLDSTHITFGVVTAGYVQGDWKVEVSRFKGREPDQERYGFDEPALDSTAVRLSWNPTANWALQASWADQVEPEQLHPGEDQTKWSASALFERGPWSGTLAFGRKTATGGPYLDAWLAEAAWRPAPAWTLFGRAERTRTDELDDHGHGELATVGKVSVGAVRDWRVSEQVSLGLGGLYAFNFVPEGLEGHYGGDPGGAMAFVRLKIG